MIEFFTIVVFVTVVRASDSYNPYYRRLRLKESDRYLDLSISYLLELEASPWKREEKERNPRKETKMNDIDLENDDQEY